MVEDLAACNRLCESVHGDARGGEPGEAIAHQSAQVVERDGRIPGDTAGIAFPGHSVGKGDDDPKALIRAAPQFGGPGFLVPPATATCCAGASPTACGWGRR